MPENRTRRLKPIHIAIIAVLLIVIGIVGYEWVHIAPSVVGKGPPTAASTQSTTQREAQAGVEGRSRDGSNDSQDAYTAQNQSREPTR
jgi:hypothetical protein